MKKLSHILLIMQTVLLISNIVYYYNMSTISIYLLYSLFTLLILQNFAEFYNKN